METTTGEISQTANSTTEGTPQIKTESLVKEITINKPTPFTGDRTRVWGFIQVCLGYLQLNRHVYTSDEAKIAFILFFLTDKEALKWKKTYLASLWEDNKGFKYLHSKNSLKFSVYFRPINQTQTANNWLISLRQGKQTVEEYLAEFRLLTSVAGMMSDTPSDNIHLSLRRSPFPIMCPPHLLNGLIKLSSMTQTTDSQWPC